MGYILLEGGAEFGGQMAMPDRRAIELAGGMDIPIALIPAAAAPDNNHFLAGQRGMRWFHSLGATLVTCPMVIDSTTAERPDHAAALCRSRLVYLLGGFPGHLAKSLANSLCWRSMLSVLANGGVIGGSSAGAMVLSDYFYDPCTDQLAPGLSLLAGYCLIPHFDTSGGKWHRDLRRLLPGALFLGLDEETAIINDAARGWTVYGKGRAVLLSPTGRKEYRAGKVIPYTRLHSPQK